MQSYALQLLDRDAVSSPRARPFLDFCADPRMPSVLVADDDPHIAPLVSAALLPYHLYTESVPDGATTLARLCGRTYDLVVLDLWMAGMHGLEVLRALRGDPRLARVPVLILTANASHLALLQSFESGADEFVRKPFDIREFGVRASRLIRGARQS
jgi:CheY-like chemotaxis protein